jgi:anti-sigma factor RsiW
MSCPESLRAQAYFDGELDALSTAALEHHLESCSECRALLEDLEQTRGALRRDLGAATAPATLRARVIRALEAESGFSAPSRIREGLWRLRTFWVGALCGAGGAVAAAAVAVLLWAPLTSDSLLDSLMAEHIDSLLPGHLIDVESTDRHTVKPWFAGHADISPSVEDFSGEGFPLVGGRADYLANQRAAVIVYQHGHHIINVFSWKSDSRIPLRDSTRNGYHMAFWKADGLQYCAVSDAGWEDLYRLQRLFRELSARETPP